MALRLAHSTPQLFVSNETSLVKTTRRWYINDGPIQ